MYIFSLKQSKERNKKKETAENLITDTGSFIDDDYREHRQKGKEIKAVREN